MRNKYVEGTSRHGSGNGKLVHPGMVIPRQARAPRRRRDALRWLRRDALTKAGDREPQRCPRQFTLPITAIGPTATDHRRRRTREWFTDLLPGAPLGSTTAGLIRARQAEQERTGLSEAPVAAGILKGIRIRFVPR